MEEMIKQAYLQKAKIITLTGDVYRVHKDNYALQKEKISNWDIDIVE